MLFYSEAAAIVRMIAVAVAHLHAMNIAHRDLKVCLEQISYNFDQLCHIDCYPHTDVLKFSG